MNATDLTVKDIDQLQHHAHSDHESENDDDPFFEYNNCKQFTMHEYKELDKKSKKFKEIDISRFFTKQPLEDPVEVNIPEEVNRLVDKKYLKDMAKIVYPDEIVDVKEWEAFDRYRKRGEHMQTSSGIPNYEACWYPLNQEYFEQRPEVIGPGKERVTPFTETEQY